MADDTLTELTAAIVGSYVEKNRISLPDLETLIGSVYATLAVGVIDDSSAPTDANLSADKATPRQIRASITADTLISFEDGKPYRTLKRHLATYGLTVEGYKAKWGLPKDYPTVAPSYSEARSAMAKSLGLGRGGVGQKPIPPERINAAPAITAPVPPKVRKVPAKPAAAPQLVADVPAAAPTSKPGRKPRATKAAIEAELVAGSKIPLPEPDFD